MPHNLPGFLATCADGTALHWRFCSQFSWRFVPVERSPEVRLAAALPSVERCDRPAIDDYFRFLVLLFFFSDLFVPRLKEDFKAFLANRVRGPQGCRSQGKLYRTEYRLEWDTRGGKPNPGRLHNVQFCPARSPHNGIHRAE